MLFAKIFGVISFIAAALLSVFYFTGSMTNEIVAAFGVTMSLLIGVYLLGVLPAMLSEEISNRHVHR